MLAVPINSAGEVIGAAKHFTEERFDKMKRALKSSKNFPWRIVPDDYKPSEGKELMPVSTKEAKPKAVTESVTEKTETTENSGLFPNEEPTKENRHTRRNRKKNEEQNN